MNIATKQATRFVRFELGCIAGFCLVGFASAALADEDVKIPARCSITSIDIYHQSERNAYVSLGVIRSPQGNLMSDGQTGQLDNTTHHVVYKPTYPELFAGGPEPFTVRVGGTWSGGAWGGWVKSTRYGQDQVVKVYPDHAEAYLYTGAQDQDWNSEVVLHFDRHCVQ